MNRRLNGIKIRIGAVRRVVGLSCLVIVVVSSASCAEIQQQVCADRLSDHFAAAETLISPTAGENFSEFRTMLSQLQGLAETADTQGCNSQTVFAVSELKAAIADLQSATTDGQFLFHGILSIFDAEKSSPLSQKGKAAVERLEGATNLLSSVGVRGLDEL